MNLLHHAKELRIRQTDAELRLWYQLRAHRFMHLKFKRQKPVGRYIVDFICQEYGVIVELDGGQHQDNAGYDQARDAWLRAQGYTVLRFWNHEVMQQMEAVLEAIRLVVMETQAALSPGPSPASGRGEPSRLTRDHPSPASGAKAGFRETCLALPQPVGLASPTVGRGAGAGGEGAGAGKTEGDGSA